jgi:hypothetical protein
MIQRRMSGQDRVVRLDDGVSQRRSWVHAEFELGLFAIIG